MDEAQLMDCFDSQHNLGNIEPGDILREDLVLDQHGHEISARQELHEHVEEVGVLEGRVQLHDPWAVGLGKDVTLGANVGELVLLEHFRLDQGLHGIDLSVRLFLYELHLAESALADNLDGVVVLWLVLRSQEPQVGALPSASAGPDRFPSSRVGGLGQLLLHLALSGVAHCQRRVTKADTAWLTSGCARGPA